MLITGVIIACSCNTLNPKGLQSKREEQDLSSFLLLDLVKWAKPIGEAVSAKSEW